MGGRGSFAQGVSVPYSYQTVGYVDGVKVLVGTGNQHGLPAESHSSMAYIKLSGNGAFREMRFYDKDHFLVKEIAFHPEKDLDPSRQAILHVHEYARDDFDHRTKRLLRASEYRKYKRFFKGGVKRWKPEM